MKARKAHDGILITTSAGKTYKLKEGASHGSPPVLYQAEAPYDIPVSASEASQFLEEGGYVFILARVTDIHEDAEERGDRVLSVEALIDSDDDTWEELDLHYGSCIVIPSSEAWKEARKAAGLDD